MTDKEEIKDGLLEEFHDNGQLVSRSNYKNGKQDGPWEDYYKNGQLQVRENYKNGKRDGPVKYFDEGDNLTKTE